MDAVFGEGEFMSDKLRKKIVAITLDPELHEWFKDYSTSKKKTVSGLVSEYIFNLSSSTTEPK